MYRKLASAGNFTANEKHYNMAGCRTGRSGASVGRWARSKALPASRCRCGWSVPNAFAAGSRRTTSTSSMPCTHRRVHRQGQGAHAVRVRGQDGYCEGPGGGGPQLPRQSGFWSGNIEICWSRIAVSLVEFRYYWAQARGVRRNLTLKETPEKAYRT